MADADWKNAKSPSAAALAEKIAGFPRVVLHQNLDGTSNYADWLLHEHDRFLIVQALRAYQTNGR